MAVSSMHKMFLSVKLRSLGKILETLYFTIMYLAHNPSRP